MRLLSLSVLFCGFAVAICGCQKPVPVPVPLPDIEIDVDSTKPQVEFSWPTKEPQFNQFSFGLAELDSKDEQSVLFCLPQFREIPQTRQDTFTLMSKATVSKEVPDKNGKIETIVEEIEVPEVRTREVKFFVYELDGEKFFRCPLSKLAVFNTKGERLNEEEAREALRDGRRAITQWAEATSDSYYGGFFDRDTLFFQSKDWVEVPFSEIES